MRQSSRRKLTKKATFRVVRQDDNGVHYVVEAGLSQAKAEELVRKFESLKHKQMYWIERE